MSDDQQAVLKIHTICLISNASIRLLNSEHFTIFDVSGCLFLAKNSHGCCLGFWSVYIKRVCKGCEIEIIFDLILEPMKANF